MSTKYFSKVISGSTQGSFQTTATGQREGSGGRESGTGSPEEGSNHGLRYSVCQDGLLPHPAPLSLISFFLHHPYYVCGCL